MRNCTSAVLGKRQIVHAMGSIIPQLGVDCSFLSSLSAWPTFASCAQALSQCHWSLHSKPGKKHFRAESLLFLPCFGNRWYCQSTAPRAADNTETDLPSRHPQQALMIATANFRLCRSRRAVSRSNDATGATGKSNTGLRVISAPMLDPRNASYSALTGKMLNNMVC